MGLFDRFFGGDEDDGTDVSVDLSGDDVTVKDIDESSSVTVTEDDPTGFLHELEDGTWFATHDIEAGTQTGETNVGTKSSISSETNKVDSEVPTTKTRDTPDSYPDIDPKTVLFPADSAILQALEIRAKNGAQQRVETAYVLTGGAGQPPTDLWALDDPSLYETATRTRLVSYGRQIAEHIANRTNNPPEQVIRIHTHPPTADEGAQPSTMPSSTDIESASKSKDYFVEALDIGPADLNFSHGIHAYYSHNLTPLPDHPRQARGIDNGVSWRGEQYRHELALYDETFRNERSVELIGP